MRLPESDGQRLVALCDQMQSMHADLEQHLWNFDDRDGFDDYDHGRKGHYSLKGNGRPN